MKPIAIVFGCTGQDGSYLCKSLLDKEFQVFGTSRKNNPNLKRLEYLGIANKVQIVCCDMESFSQTKNTIEKLQPGEIYNLSAQSSVGDSFKKPVETQRSIVNTTLNILEVCREIKFEGNLFFAGSSEIFGSTDTPAVVNTKIDLRSPYATAKYQSFLLSKMYREIYKINCVTGILFNHESPLRDERFVMQKIINTAIKIKKGITKELLIGNILIKRDWGYAEEYVEAMQLINRSKTKKDYIICSGESHKLKDVIEIVFSQLGLNWKDYVKSSKDLIRKSEIETSEGNPEELYNELGWKAVTDIKKLINILIKNELKEN